MRRLSAALAATVLLAAGCGGDDDDNGTESAATEPPPTATTGPGTTETTESTETGESPGTETAQEPGAETTSPEDQPGGAGDEEPIRTEVVLEARDGRIRPSRVRVPPYIGVRVELRTSEDRAYALRIGGKTIRVGDGVASASTRVEGMRPGESVIARPVGGGNEVEIEASAEPGP